LAHSCCAGGQNSMRSGPEATEITGRWSVLAISCITSATPLMIPGQPAQDALRGMGFFPLASRVFVGFGQSGVGVDGTQYLVQPQAVAHGQYEFSQQIGAIGTHDGGSENLVLARRG